VVDTRYVGIKVANPQQIVVVCAAWLKATLDLRSTLATQGRHGELPAVESTVVVCEAVTT